MLGCTLTDNLNLTSLKKGNTTMILGQKFVVCHSSVSRLPYLTHHFKRVLCKTLMQEYYNFPDTNIVCNLILEGPLPGQPHILRSLILLNNTVCLTIY